MPATHQCKRCGQQHELRETVFRDGGRHHFYECLVVRKRFYVTRDDSLTVPMATNRSAQRRIDRSAAEQRQMTLL